ncbi:MAG: histidine ammonia-lyase, partial [Baekduia sp.]|nr:histidine ammonia-lyase [Baekduia sp.]
NSMGALAALKARTVVESAAHVIATELVCACQGLDVRPSPGRAGRGSLAAHALVRSVVATLDADRAPAGDVAAVAQLVASGAFTQLLDELPEEPPAGGPEPTKGP